MIPIDGPVLCEPLVALELAASKLGVLKAVPPSSRVLSRPLVWRMLADAGVATAVVRMPFSYPASAQATVTVSNRVGVDEISVFGFAPNTGVDLVSPADLEPVIEDFTRPTATPEAATPEGAVPSESALPDHSLRQRYNLGMLRLSMDIDARTFAVADKLLRTHPEIRAMFIYISGFDTTAHHLWRYWFPDAFPGNRPTDAEVGVFGPSRRRYLELLDEWIGLLVKHFAVPPNLIVMSDHGHRAMTGRSLFTGWHSAEGVFMAEGPDIHPRPAAGGRPRVRYYDVVPTVLDLFHLPPPADSRGHSLLSPPPVPAAGR